MALILNIDTANEIASVSIAENGVILQSLENTIQKNHASFLHVAIKEIINKFGHSIKDIDSVAVTAGPGSYTGIRVGIASAKGFCLALHCPLILINSLELLALSAINNTFSHDKYYLPLIDARRMEVYYALYNFRLDIIENPAALILDNSSFQTHLNQGKIVFCGSGIQKFKEICNHPNAVFITEIQNAPSMATLSNQKYLNEKFDDVISSEPFYVKEFYSTFKIS